MVRRIWFVGSLLAVSIVIATATRVCTASPEPPTRIETDQTNGAIRFIVNGREEARIDTTGLHVRQSILYGGPITSIGASNYDPKATAGHAR